MKECKSWSEEIGCCHTFDGKCMKEECQTYLLIKKLDMIKQIVLEAPSPVICFNCKKQIEDGICKDRCQSYKLERILKIIEVTND